MTRNLKIKVLIIDQSKLIRQTLERILLSDQEIITVIVASEPFIAEHKIKAMFPDVVIMDVETPSLDGVTFLKKLIESYSIPVIVCSRVVNKNFGISYNKQHSKRMQIIQKPKTNVTGYLEETKQEIREMVKEAAEF